MSKAALMYCCQDAPHAGDIQRALALADELSEQFEVTMLLNEQSSQTIIASDSTKLVFLPAHQAGEWQHPSPARRDSLLQAYHDLRPRVVVIEGFPFGQGPVHEEYLPLLELARSGRYGESLVACMTDSILVADPPGEKAQSDRIADILNRSFDIVIVRSDPVFARIEEFFQPGSTLHTPLYHTGFVVRQPNRAQRVAYRNKQGVVVSADGQHGMNLFRSAIEAHRTLQRIIPLPMTVTTGERLSEGDWRTLQSLAQGLPALSLKRGSPDSSAEMAAARWSVNQCDYNSAVDILRTQTPSLFVPRTGKSHREQIERAKRLVYWGAGRLLMPRHLNAASLINEIHQLTRFESRSMNFDLNGANNAAQLIAQIVYHNNYTPISARPSSDTRLH
jgi:predicted glycosyltransferase